MFEPGIYKNEMNMNSIFSFLRVTKLNVTANAYGPCPSMEQRFPYFRVKPLWRWKQRVDLRWNMSFLIYSKEQNENMFSVIDFRSKLYQHLGPNRRCGLVCNTLCKHILYLEEHRDF